MPGSSPAYLLRLVLGGLLQLGDPRTLTSAQQTRSDSQYRCTCLCSCCAPSLAVSAFELSLPASTSAATTSMCVPRWISTESTQSARS
ncbi:hypothetical protein B0H13DRAFT_2008002 [Mycena leptocephala]|nr:hypothetical protein B0H13DRAFT_2008002 [Mycena leptocephala]